MILVNEGVYAMLATLVEFPEDETLSIRTTLILALLENTRHVPDVRSANNVTSHHRACFLFFNSRPTPRSDIAAYREQLNLDHNFVVLPNPEL